MSDKILVIIGTAEPEKAHAGAMYAVNALMHSWMNDVEYVGPLISEAIRAGYVPMVW